MADLTNQQLLDNITQMIDGVTNVINDMTDVMVTKEDLKNELRAFVTKTDLKGALKDLATKSELKNELTAMEFRLTNRIKSSHTTNIKYHLETRADIGELNRKFDGLRAGLAQAAKPV